MNQHLLEERKKKHLDNPAPGDLWHERLQVVLLVVALVDEFIIVSKAYNVDQERYLETDPSKFLVLTKEEFEKETAFADPLFGDSAKWIKLALSFNSADDSNIKKLVEDKKQDIKNGNIPEVGSLKNPQSGDVWTLKDGKAITIIDKYLKEYLIISYDDTLSITRILNNEKDFINIRMMHYEEFKFCVLKNQTIEEGFSAKVEPLLLENAVNKFKQLN